MTNITIGPGGGVVANGVVTYLPSCSVISYSDISYSAAEAYDITSTDYLEVGRVGQRLSGGGGRSLPSHAAASCSDEPLRVHARHAARASCCGRHRCMAPSDVQKLIPTVIPGIILGILSLLGFIFFSLWT